MDQWTGKIALVTGASVGIGAQIARAVAEHGVKVIAIARRLDKLQELAASIKGEFKTEVYPMSCDLRNEEEILKIFRWADTELGGIDVLINNAGVLGSNTIIEDTTESIRNIIDVNVTAMAICSREFAQSVKRRGTSGHIININSVAGHFPESILIPVSVYSATKCAVTGITQSLRNELINAGLNIRITSISPGLVKTDMVQASSVSDGEAARLPMLLDTDISDAVIYSLGTPKRVEVSEVILIPHSARINPFY